MVCFCYPTVVVAFITTAAQLSLGICVVLFFFGLSRRGWVRVSVPLDDLTPFVYNALLNDSSRFEKEPRAGAYTF